MSDLKKSVEKLPKKNICEKDNNNNKLASSDILDGLKKVLKN
jgi:hypothetical protein